MLPYAFGFSYQLDFRIPGISPRLASSRKQMRQRSKSRKYPRLRPQRKQRRTIREENFGRLRERAITDFLAIGSGTDGKAERAEERQPFGPRRRGGYHGDLETKNKRHVLTL